jgi:hypothetical protein
LFCEGMVIVLPWDESNKYYCKEKKNKKEGDPLANKHYEVLS